MQVKLWAVGEWNDQGRTWFLLAVLTTLAGAMDVVDGDARRFVGPLFLDQPVQPASRTMLWPGAFYPILEPAKLAEAKAAERPLATTTASDPGSMW